MRQSELHISHKDGTKALVIRLQGSLCALEAIRFKHQLISYIKAQPSDLTLDLRAVTTLDLGGLNALAVAAQRLQESGSRLEVLAPKNGALQEWVALTKMGRLFNIID